MFGRRLTSGAWACLAVLQVGRAWAQPKLAQDTWGAPQPPISPSDAGNPGVPPEGAPEPAEPRSDPPAAVRVSASGPTTPTGETRTRRRRRELTDGCADCYARSHLKGAQELNVRYTLEGIEVRGNSRTSPRVILRYVRFKAGDVLDVDDPEVELTRFRLLGTGFFRDVQFSLRKGSDRGLVVLRIDVTERNTIVVNDISMGLSADADTRGHAKRLSAYAGLDVAETNLGGTGITLGAAAAIAEQQRAIRVRFLDPAFLGSPFMTSGYLLFNDTRDYFGNASFKWADPLNNAPTSPAVVRYKRFGGALGVGRDLSVSTQLWLTYRLETINASVPLEASHLRGYAREPIDFHVIPGRSVLSTIGGTLQLDTRDQPVLPTRGWFLSFHGELSLLPLSLDYDYQRFELDVSRWWRLPGHDHVFKLSLFAGGIAGDAPFFEQFYVGDFTDFLPDRVLGVNFDRRPPPNFLGTEIVEVRYGDFAAKIGGEYRIPVYRGRRSIYGIDFFASAGLYAVAGRRDLTHPPLGYSGLARIPVDVTGNLGLRLDTSAGGFTFAFSNVLSFIPVRGEGPAGGRE
ncbi:MAG TPA: BamA/TamA family outer membrane protein [Polyangiaceae bacterium]|nr:BamA/TamA family outer membrane protein [Polyangiaceae bacterium]